MKISIVGAGPAGLYFACYLKSFKPDFDITIFEAGNESINSNSIAYTLQKSDAILLERIDATIYQQLLNDETTPTISRALFKTNNQQRTLPIPEEFSVTREQLLGYLMTTASSLGIHLIKKTVLPEELLQLKNDFDLVLAADGVSSIARELYKDELKTEEHQAKLKFSWFTNETKQETTEACFYAFNSAEGLTLLRSYPLTKYMQAVVIEMTESCLASAELKGKNPTQAIPYLNNLLNENGDDIKLIPANLPWYTSTMNTTGKLYYENLALIGDAAYTFHYSADQGVTTSFSMAYTLAQCILKNNNINLALAHYNHSINLLLTEPAKKSLRQLEWFENIDRHYRLTDSKDWLDLFLQKDEFGQIKKTNNECNTGVCR